MVFHFYIMLRSVNLRARYLHLMKRGEILVSASRARMGVVLIEPSMLERKVNWLHFFGADVCRVVKVHTSRR